MVDHMARSARAVTGSSGRWTRKCRPACSAGERNMLATSAVTPARSVGCRSGARMPAWAPEKSSSASTMVRNRSAARTAACRSACSGAARSGAAASRSCRGVMQQGERGAQFVADVLEELHFGQVEVGEQLHPLPFVLVGQGVGEGDPELPVDQFEERPVVLVQRPVGADPEDEGADRVGPAADRERQHDGLVGGQRAQRAGQERGGEPVPQTVDFLGFPGGDDPVDDPARRSDRGVRGPGPGRVPVRGGRCQAEVGDPVRDRVVVDQVRDRERDAHLRGCRQHGQRGPAGVPGAAAGFGHGQPAEFPDHPHPALVQHLRGRFRCHGEAARRAAVHVDDRAVRVGEVTLLRIPVAVHDLSLVLGAQGAPLRITMVSRVPTRSHASGQVCRAGRPNAAGCFPPIIAANASLYTATRSGPQWITIGNPDPKQTSTIVRNTGDHPSTAPSGVADQSIDRNKPRSSPASSTNVAVGSVAAIWSPSPFPDRPALIVQRIATTASCRRIGGTNEIMGDLARWHRSTRADPARAGCVGVRPGACAAIAVRVPWSAPGSSGVDLRC